jgi:hypothetical protein
MPFVFTPRGRCVSGGNGSSLRCMPHPPTCWRVPAQETKEKSLTFGAGLYFTVELMKTNPITDKMKIETA